MASVTQDKYVVEFEYYCKNYLFQTNETNDYYLYENENKMFESDKEDEGMIMDDNLNVGLQQIASYFESPSYTLMVLFMERKRFLGKYWN